jgi:hypothetical protein
MHPPFVGGTSEVRFAEESATTTIDRSNFVSEFDWFRRLVQMGGEMVKGGRFCGRIWRSSQIRRGIGEGNDSIEICIGSIGIRIGIRLVLLGGSKWGGEMVKGGFVGEFGDLISLEISFLGDPFLVDDAEKKRKEQEKKRKRKRKREEKRERALLGLFDASLSVCFFHEPGLSRDRVTCE